MKKIIFIFTILLSLPIFSQKPIHGYTIDLSKNKQNNYFSRKKDQGNEFTIRGTKGFFWSPEQYISEIPTLKSYGMNFLATCYGSFFRDYKFEIGTNDWWVPFNPEQEKEWKEVIEESKKHNINFCFGMNPMLYSARPLDTENEEDFETLLSRYKWFQDQGVNWFYLALDDLHLHEGMKVDGIGQSDFTNRLYDALLENDPNCKMIFCPTWYWGDTMNEPDKKAYLIEISTYLNEDILCFWTGDDVVSNKVTIEDAIEYKNIIGHDLILWDNYPVNDFNNSLHLAPVTGRDPELNNVVHGIMGNPMRDNLMNRMPLFTMADYAINPKNYNPSQSIVQAIKYNSENKQQEIILRDLISYYPGALTYRSKSTRINSARDEFKRLLHTSEKDAIKYKFELENLLFKFINKFPGIYPDTKNVIQRDILWMDEQLKEK
ncbi:beta-N-acetylglucosaminidase domain-containing protein [Dysgonomonadaceae bacterium zrk40]|nr:beta-N-acetylglucosaminidase domain-containing protein [Dysgonomonadaceae bacterium zrk40]